MPEFRKWILALAVLALFAGLASAQVTGNGSSTGAFSCATTNASVTPTLRAEGYTELTGDVVLICNGGNLPPTNTSTPLPTANFTIFVNTAVTSRLLPSTTLTNASEALLMIDEPGAALGPSPETGYGPAQAQVPCGTANIGVGAGTGGCVEYLGTSTSQITAGCTALTCGGVPVYNTVASPTACTATVPAAGCAVGPNVFQGLVSGNQVNFYGIPVVPPGTTGNRVYRITNIRVNANGITAGGPVAGQATASISISSGLGITNSTLTIGFVSQGLSSSSTGLRNNANTGSSSGANLTQCSSVSVTSTGSTAAVGLLSFAENFPTAFKTRQANQLAGNVAQNIPGTIYPSENGFVPSVAAVNPGYSGTATAFGTTYYPGQADYGTRLKAVFNAVPSGVSIYVSTRDVTNAYAVPPALVSGQLVVAETASDEPAGTVPASGQTTSYTSASGNAIGIAPVAINAGTGSAVFEVVATNPAAIDTLNFLVLINYSANAASNSPAPGTFTVTLSFAPTPSGGGFTSTTGAAASSTLTLPRFSDSLDITKNIATINLCTTPLLYPYVINVNGFDTGLAIANTSTDNLGAGGASSVSAQAGTCSLQFFGSGAPTTNPFVTPTVPTATVYATLASTVAPGFSGYMIANCNFQYAHGFAFVSDVGARNLAMGYLALVVASASITRGGSAENYNN